MIPTDDDEADKFFNLIKKTDGTIDIDLEIPKGMTPDQFLRNFKESIFELLSKEMTDAEEISELKNIIDEMRLIPYVEGRNSNE